MPLTVRVTPLGASMLEVAHSVPAPRDRIWPALTNPALIPAWLFAMGTPMVDCEFEPVPGGRIRYAWSRPDGIRFGLSGRVIEISPPERIVHSELFDDDWTGGETTVTTLLLPEGTGTRVVMTTEYRTAEVRDAAMAPGRVAGIEAAFRHLDRMLAA